MTKMDWLNGIQSAARTRLGKLGLGFIALATLVIVAWMNPIRESDAPKAQAKEIAYDQQISIPKIPGGASSMGPVVEDPADLGGQVGVVSRWTAIKNGDDPGQLLIDLTNIHLWRKIERTGLFQYIPKAHTMDENRNRLILYELVNDTFECAEGMAEKLSLTVYYEDGAQQTYYPWRYPGANEWIPVRPDTTLSREMKFVCAVQLASDSQTPTRLDRDRILGTWQVDDGAQGRFAAGPIVISETQITWTARDSHQCTSEYQLASRTTGSTFPGGPTASDTTDDAYTTFVLELKGPLLDPCSQRMNSLTISFASTQCDLAHFTAFLLAPQGYGTMRRVSSAGRSNHPKPITFHSS
jgi:hypothetical protein